jgi:hypothetical protein
LKYKSKGNSQPETVYFKLSSHSQKEKAVGLSCPILPSRAIVQDDRAGAVELNLDAENFTSSAISDVLLMEIKRSFTMDAADNTRDNEKIMSLLAI